MTIIFIFLIAIILENMILTAYNAIINIAFVLRTVLKRRVIISCIICCLVSYKVV